MQKTPTAAIILGLIPFVGMCFTVPLWDRVTPMVLGLPFNMFWLLAWIVIASLCLMLANRAYERRGK